MPQKKVQLSEAIDFIRNNGYLLAVYEKEDDGNFHKRVDDIRSIPIDSLIEVMVRTTGAATDFTEFESVDGQYCFRLHNNFNVPDVIPVIKRG